MVCSSMRLEAAALRFNHIYIYLTNCFTGKTVRPRKMGNDTAKFDVKLQSVAIRVNFTRTIKKLQNIRRHKDWTWRCSCC